MLFKPRNGEPWTAEERGFLQRELRELAKRWAPGFFLFLLPGGLVLAPLYAALLDLRRHPNARAGAARPVETAPAEALEPAPSVTGASTGR